MSKISVFARRIGSAFCLATVLLSSVKIGLAQSEAVDGLVSDAQTGRGIANARISLEQFEAPERFAVSNYSGAFVLPNLPPTNARRLFVIEAAGYAPTAISPPDGDESSLSVVLSRGNALRINVVDGKQQPVSGVQISVGRIALLQPDTKARPSAQFVKTRVPTMSQSSDKDGVATVENLPVSGLVELVATREGYSTTTQLVPLPGEQVTLQIRLQSVIEGRVILGGATRAQDEPLRNSTNIWAKVQPPWRNATPDAEGFFRIIDVIPSPGDTSSTSFNIDLRGNIGPELRNKPMPIAPDMTANYIPGTWDQLLTQKRNGVTKRWIGHIQRIRVPAETTVHHDLRMMPMAHLKGQIKGMAAARVATVRVWYDDPNTIYGAPDVKCDARGRFDVWVPENTTKLRFGRSRGGGRATFTIAPTKAFEVRALSVPVTIFIKPKAK